MAKTIAIIGANYSTNALDTVEFVDTEPCTAIALNKNSVTFMSIGATEQLTATPTPADTTDEITWATSDDDVATVVNGLVTSVGVGTATITVTCGTCTATCTVTSRAFMDTDNVQERVGYYLDGAAAADSGNGLSDWRTSNAKRGGFASSTGTYPLYDLSGVYPYQLPNGTGQVKVTIANGASITKIQQVHWFNHATSTSSSCKLIYKQAGLSPTDGVITMSVPEVQGFPTIDAIIICFEINDGTMTSAMLEDVTVEFLPTAS